jgi:hypothetical protein
LAAGAVLRCAPLRERLLKAVDHALAGDWQAAHVIAQEHEGERLADWMHAVAHRMEGDLGNAAYWYGLCGRSRAEELPIDDELRLIKAEFASS